MGWGHARAVETCGAGGRAATPHAVAPQTGTALALRPSSWRGGGSRGWCPAVGQLGLGRTEEEADTHVTVVLSNCSARLSMADDCKYGSSLSVCLSVCCVSVLASPVFVLCGCPCPPPAPGLVHLCGPHPRAACLAPAPGGPLPVAPAGFGGCKVLDGFVVPGCGEVQGLGMGWEGTAVGQCHVTRDSQTQADPVFSLHTEGERGHWRHEQGEQCVLGSQGCSSRPLVPQFPLEAMAGLGLWWVLRAGASRWDSTVSCPVAQPWGRSLARL